MFFWIWLTVILLRICPTLHLTFFPVDEQLTRTSSRQVESDCSITSGARQVNPTVKCSTAMASQLTAGERLAGPGHVRLIRGNQSVPGMSLW